MKVSASRKLATTFLMGMFVLMSVGLPVLAESEYLPDYPWSPGGGDENEGWDNSTYAQNDSSAQVNGYLTVNAMNPFLLDWELTAASGGPINTGMAYDGTNLTDSLISIGQDLWFNITIADYDGFADVKKVQIRFWYDGDEEDTNITYSAHNATYPADEYENWHFILEYNNETGTPEWYVWDSTNGTNGGIVFNETIFRTLNDGNDINMVSGSYSNASLNTSIYNGAHQLSFLYRHGNQSAFAPGDGVSTDFPNTGFDNPDTIYTQSWVAEPSYAQRYLNDPNSWNVEIIMADTNLLGLGWAALESDYAYPIAEYGTYRHTSIYVNDTTPYASADPGNWAETWPFQIKYSANAPHFLNVSVWDNLTRNDWARYLAWIGTSNITINATGDFDGALNTKGPWRYDSSTPATDNGELNRSEGGHGDYPEAYYSGVADGDHPSGQVIYTSGHDHSFKGQLDTNPDDDDTDSVSGDTSYAWLMEYDIRPYRWAYQDINYKFRVYIPVGTMGGSYHSVITFRVEQF